VGTGGIVWSGGCVGNGGGQFGGITMDGGGQFGGITMDGGGGLPSTL